MERRAGGVSGCTRQCACACEFAGERKRCGKHRVLQVLGSESSPSVCISEVLGLGVVWEKGRETAARVGLDEACASHHHLVPLLQDEAGAR